MSPSARTRRPAEATPAAAPRDLVFTSAGDHSSVHHWLRGRRGRFDLCVVYYGDGPDEARLRALATHFFVRRGSKFQNLHWLWRTHPGLLEGYDAVFVLDDDIQIGGASIARLFRTLRRFDLWLLQPALLPEGRQPALGSAGPGSPPITEMRPGNLLRWTTYVEVCVPLLRTDRLIDFLRVYDPRLIGWGVDIHMCHHLGLAGDRRIAIVDSEPCINPYVRPGSLSTQREIERLASDIERSSTWRTVAGELGIPPDPVCEELGAVRQGPIGRVRTELARFRLRRWARDLIPTDIDRPRTRGPRMAPPTPRKLSERIATLRKGPNGERIDLLVEDLARERAGIRAELTGIYGRLDSLEANLERANSALRDLIEQTGEVIARNRELAVQLRVVESSLAGSASLARKLRRELAPADEGADEGAPEGEENAGPVSGA